MKIWWARPFNKETRVTAGELEYQKADVSIRGQCGGAHRKQCVQMAWCVFQCCRETLLFEKNNKNINKMIEIIQTRSTVCNLHSSSWKMFSLSLSQLPWLKGRVMYFLYLWGVILFTIDLCYNCCMRLVCFFCLFCQLLRKGSGFWQDLIYFPDKE